MWNLLMTFQPKNKWSKLSSRVIWILLCYPIQSILQSSEQGRKVRNIYVYLFSHFSSNQINILGVYWIIYGRFSEFQKLSLSKLGKVQNLPSENEFICMWINNHLHIVSFVLGIALKQRLEATRKWSNLVRVDQTQLKLLEGRLRDFKNFYCVQIMWVGS